MDSFFYIDKKQVRVISHLLIVIELLLSYGVGAAVVVVVSDDADDGAAVVAVVSADDGTDVLVPPPVAANLTVIVWFLATSLKV